MKMNYILAMILAWSVTTHAQIEQYGTADDGTPLHWTVVLPGTSGTHTGILLIPGGEFKLLHPIPLNVSQDLANANYLVFNQVEHRTAPHGKKLPGQMSTGQFPDQTNDVTIAANAARTDPRSNGKVFVIGGSSGASHAEWLGALALVDAAVLFSPATQYDDPVSLQDSQFANDVNNYAPNNLAAASPDSVLMTTSAPIFIASFSQDEIPAPQYNLAVAKLTSLGIPFQAILISGRGHAYAAWSHVKSQVLAFLGSR